VGAKTRSWTRKAAVKAKVSIKQQSTRPRPKTSSKKKKKSAKKEDAKLPDARLIRRIRRDEKKEEKLGPIYGPVPPPADDVEILVPVFGPIRRYWVNRPPNNQDGPIGPAGPNLDEERRQRLRDEKERGIGREEKKRRSQSSDNDGGDNDGGVDQQRIVFGPHPQPTREEKIAQAIQFFHNNPLYPSPDVENWSEARIDELAESLVLFHQCWILKIHYRNGDVRQIPLYYNSHARAILWLSSPSSVFLFSASILIPTVAYKIYIPVGADS